MSSTNSPSEYKRFIADTLWRLKQEHQAKMMANPSIKPLTSMKLLQMVANAWRQYYEIHNAGK